MRSKPLIGLNADYRAAKKDSPAFSFVCAGYYDSIIEAGGVPIVLPPVSEEDDLERMLDLVDGMVLVGGADLDPRRDGYMLHPSVRHLDPRREDFDRAPDAVDRQTADADLRHRRRPATAERLAGRHAAVAHSRRPAQGPAAQGSRWIRPTATVWRSSPGR